MNIFSVKLAPPHFGEKSQRDFGETVTKVEVSGVKKITPIALGYIISIGPVLHEI